MKPDGISKPRGIWPEKIRKKIRIALDQFNSLDQTIGTELDGELSKDVTAESIELIEAFAPDLTVLGRQLKGEKKDTFAGVQYRVVRTRKTHNAVFSISTSTRNNSAP